MSVDKMQEKLKLLSKLKGTPISRLSCYHCVYKAKVSEWVNIYYDNKSTRREIRSDYCDFHHKKFSKIPNRNKYGRFVCEKLFGE